MFFQSWQDFWTMGGHGFYVWTAYGITAAALIVFMFTTLRGDAAVLQQTRKDQQRLARLKQTEKGNES